jgi:hypothetical protein
VVEALVPKSYPTLKKLFIRNALMAKQKCDDVPSCWTINLKSFYIYVSSYCNHFIVYSNHDHLKHSETHCIQDLINIMTDIFVQELTVMVNYHVFNQSLL